MDTELIKPAEAAQILAVDPKTIYTWANKGMLRSVVLPNGRLRFHRTDIESILHNEAA